MALILCVGLKESGDLTAWYADQAGEILNSTCLPMALRFEESGLLRYARNDESIQFNFILRRDDETLLPVYELGTPVLKTMTVFSEFVGSVAELTQDLGLQFVSLRLSDQAGSFELEISGDVSLKTSLLLQAGLEILSYTRGFQMTNFRSSLSKTML